MTLIYEFSGKERQINEIWRQETQEVNRTSWDFRFEIIEYLQEQYPGQYQRVKRILQRRVADWKAQYGPPKEVMFELRHIPGEIGQSDFTELKKI